MPSYRLLLAGLVSIAGSAEILAAPTGTPASQYELSFA